MNKLEPFKSLKAHANGLNIVGRQHPTLLGPTMLWLDASVCMEPQQYWHLLALVAYSLKPVKLLGPCKRTQYFIDGQQHPTMLGVVGTCCVCTFARALTVLSSECTPCEITEFYIDSYLKEGKTTWRRCSYAVFSRIVTSKYRPGKKIIRTH